MFAPTLPPPATIAYIRLPSATRVGSQERTTSVSVAIAVCVGQTVRRPRSAVERRAARVEDPHDDARRLVAALDDLADHDVRVVAVGRDDGGVGLGDPAFSSTTRSIPWPTTKPPRHSPSRASAPSSSSTHVTSQPSAARFSATDDPIRPHPMTTAFIPDRERHSPRTRRRGTRRRAPRSARAEARGRPSARRSATAAASAATSRARSGRPGGAPPRRRSRARSSVRGRRRRARPRRRSPRRAPAPPRARPRRSRRRRPDSSASSARSRGTFTTVIASIRAPFSFASAIAVATISSPMSPSFIGTRMLRKAAPTGNDARGSTSSSMPRCSRHRVHANTTSPSASQAGPA